MVHGLSPEAAIKTWASQPQFALTRSQLMDRHHFHAFIAHLVQVCACIVDRLVTRSQTDFVYEFLAKYGAPELSTVRFPCFCVLCGFWPLFVYFDGNKKSSSSLKGISLGLCCAAIVS